MNHHKKVIVVDDNVDHLLVIRLVLERRGYEVLALKHCEDLLASIKTFQPTVIFMDHEMPAITGIEATQQIKSDDDCKHIPVVYFSGRYDIKELAARAGADDWLSKPYRIEDLVGKASKFVTPL